MRNLRKRYTDCNGTVKSRDTLITQSEPVVQISKLYLRWMTQGIELLDHQQTLAQ